MNLSAHQRDGDYRTNMEGSEEDSKKGSAAGPNGIPYNVYTMCPLLLRRVWTLSRVVWRKRNIPACWQVAEVIVTPKEKNAREITQFRTISVLNVEGKIFFSVMPRD